MAGGIIYPVLSLGGLGLLFGIILGFVSGKFAVHTDPRIEEVRELLPGANCCGCGYSGCDAYAEAVVKGEAKPDLCNVGGEETARRIADLMGLECHPGKRMVAFVHCHGTCEKAPDSNIYHGLSDCRQALSVPGEGPKACHYGCIGLGSCVKACQFGGISIRNGVAVVDEDLCRGCGMCVQACPKGVIEMIPADLPVRVACSNPEKGKDVREVCSMGCLACGMCARNCPEEAITMVNNLPVIDADKCVGCLACVEKCPVDTFRTRSRNKLKLDIPG
jgi:Na+-translocating ferredoxin:NAD+ oxidoreductase RNF subunit RnfB